MPPKNRTYERSLEDWVRAIADKDACLYGILREALVARSTAIEDGAWHYEACAAVVKAADDTMDSIRFEHVKGRAAWKAATTALRKYTTAMECVVPTATKFSRKKRKR